MRTSFFHLSIPVLIIFFLFDIGTPQVLAQGRTSGRSREPDHAIPVGTAPGSTPGSSVTRDIGRTRPTEVPETPAPVSSGSRDIGRTRPTQSVVTVETVPPRERERTPSRPPHVEDYHPTVIVIQEGEVGGCTIVDVPAEPDQPSGLWIREGVRFGKDVTLADSYVMPEYSGYDFSELLKRSFDHPFTDIFVEQDHGDLMMSVREDSEIMDIGSILVPVGAIYIPRAGWSPTHQERLRLGHEYVVRTWDHHYAKFYVCALLQDRVTFDWAYQYVADDDGLGQVVFRNDRSSGKFQR